MIFLLCSERQKFALTAFFKTIMLLKQIFAFQNIIKILLK